MTSRICKKSQGPYTERNDLCPIKVIPVEANLILPFPQDIVHFGNIKLS